MLHIRNNSKWVIVIHKRHNTINLSIKNTVVRQSPVRYDIKVQMTKEKYMNWIPQN